MDDFLELGIEGIDKLVDKHFDKIPDDYLDPHRYSLGHSRSKHKHRSSSASAGPAGGTGRRDEAEGEGSPDRDGEDSEYFYGDDERLRRSGHAPMQEQQDDYYTQWPQDYSGYPPQPPSQYIPPSAADFANNRFRRPDFSPEPLGRRSTNVPERPRPLDRRSSSHPDLYRYHSPPASDRRARDRRGSLDRKKEKGTDAMGTVVLTLLGAAAGGLAASALTGGLDKKDKRKKEDAGRANRRGSLRDDRYDKGTLMYRDTGRKGRR